jgi:hypothetical protein
MIYHQQVQYNHPSISPNFSICSSSPSPFRDRFEYQSPWRIIAMVHVDLELGLETHYNDTLYRSYFGRSFR